MQIVTGIEPVLPTLRVEPLRDKAVLVLERSAELTNRFRSPLVADIATLTRWMHCYYSNRIEGVETRVRDYEVEVQSTHQADTQRRDRIALAKAHLDTQIWARGYAGSVYASSFLQEVHKRFYSALPPHLVVSTSISGAREPMLPGELRTRDVRIGQHEAPSHAIVQGMLRHFQDRYDSPDAVNRVTQVIAVAASHHRLTWIHPFRDGNGRVARLFSDTLIHRLGLSSGMWSLSRGLSRHRDEYYARLHNADQVRMSSAHDDGRGNLSERALYEFCDFILDVMLDQIAFADRIFGIDTLMDRMKHYVFFGDPGLDQRLFLLMRDALLRGEIPRGQASNIIGCGERHGRSILSKALKQGLLKSDTVKGPVRLAFPAKVLPFYFPELFPDTAM